MQLAGLAVAVLVTLPCAHPCSDCAGLAGCLSSRKDGIVFVVADWIEPGLDLAKAFQAERIPLLSLLVSHDLELA